MTTLLLVDDHQMFLAGSRMLLEKHGFEVHTASSGAEAMAMIRSAPPFDVYLFDLNLPETSGFELTRYTLEQHPDALILILTGEELSEHFDRLIELGVSGMLEKSSTEHDLLTGIQLAQQGRMALPLSLARQLRTLRHQPQAQQAGASRSSKLTPNEISVLQLVKQGCKNKDIASALFMSQRNVEYLLSNAFEKLGASSRQEAVAKAAEQLDDL
jgi:two-component system, NarL family, competent response regulator ComA